MTYIITTNEGTIIDYESEATYQAALDWYNATPKAELIAWYVDWDEAIVGEIWADCDCSRLTPDWADVVMARWAEAEIVERPAFGDEAEGER